ncbi:MAG TPA: hypothetical protein VF178_14380 [Gemmatimonadaceae bacterium]
MGKPLQRSDEPALACEFGRTLCAVFDVGPEGRNAKPLLAIYEEVDFVG